MNAKHYQTVYLGVVVVALLVGCSGGNVSPTVNIPPIQPLPQAPSTAR